MFDERRRGLEQDYFNRKDKESLERLRAARQEEARAKGEAGATMQCPRCDGTLREVEQGDVRIDRCDKCHGIWLDAGELEQLSGQEPQGAGKRLLSILWPGSANR
jgi:ribosomal protein L37AE/L43A